MDTYTIWVCADCMLHHANGECGTCYTEEGHDRDVFNLYHPKDLTMGMLDTEHNCVPDWDGSRIDCDCETDSFSWYPCEGCGSALGGERHAFTVWEN